MRFSFNDRRDAGLRLAERLEGLLSQAERDNAIVLALPRGGAAVGFEIASRFAIPLDVLIVRKIGFPGQPELAIGACAETGGIFLNQSLIEAYGISGAYIRDETERLMGEIKKRVDFYRGGRGLPPLGGKTVVLADDGVATGASFMAAIDAIKTEKASRLIAALPVAPARTAREIREVVDEFVCLEEPSAFVSVGGFYRDFSQVTDEEVKELLRKASGFSGARR